MPTGVAPPGDEGKLAAGPHAEIAAAREDMLVASSDRGGAGASHGEAIAIALQQYAKLWEVRAAKSLARLWHDQGRCTEPRALLAPVDG